MSITLRPTFPQPPSADDVLGTAATGGAPARAHSPAVRASSFDCNELRSVHSNLIARLAAIPQITIPRLWIEPDPEHIRAIAAYMLAVADANDRWAKEVGEAFARNVGVRASLDDFTSPFRDAIEGNATYQIERVAETIEEDRREEGEG